MAQGLEAKRQEVKKHIATIHCSNSLSLLQRKISNALLFHAYPELTQQEIHEIPIRQLCQLIGYQGNNFEAIKQGVRGLITTIIEWNLIDEDTKEEDWTASSILASVNLKGPICSYSYSPHMRVLLYKPSMYGKINLLIQAKFKSNYGLALYENCIRYQGLPYTKWFDYGMFRALMGVPNDKYKIFRDFKKRVLDISVQEVNSHSEMQIVPEIQRKGREVVSIRFKLEQGRGKTEILIQSQQEIKKSESELTVSENLKHILLNDFKISARIFDMLSTKYEENYIWEKINLIKSTKTYEEGKIEDLAGYLFTAIKEDYKAPQSSKTRQVEIKQKNLSNIKKVQEYRNEYDYKYVPKKLYQIFESLEPTEKERLLQHFKGSLPVLLLSQYEKFGLSLYHPLIMDELVSYAKNKNWEILKLIESFDEFCRMKESL